MHYANNKQSQIPVKADVKKADKKYKKESIIFLTSLILITIAEIDNLNMQGLKIDLVFYFDTKNLMTQV